ncbi:MAG: hypothetical protein D6718_04185 [Acidobacteria bacterium]|nr:MAG: hypothetical protein D6718_04185 [Acidobacteriota bacterium]
MVPPSTFGRRGIRRAGGASVFRFLISLFAAAARFFLLGLAVLIFSRLLRALAGGRARPTPRSSPPARPELLVRDPVCGVRLPRSRALAASFGPEPVYFCSEECLRNYDPRS